MFAVNYVSSCAQERQYCQCNGDVFYGKNDASSLEELKNDKYNIQENINCGVECTNNVFGGDPLPGASKQCFCATSYNPT